VLAAAESEGGGTFNIGTGIETTVNDLHRLCARTVGVAAEPRHLAVRAGDARRSVLDATRAERELGWRPQVTLDDGLRRTWASIGPPP
jgi:UDP-glucose 4-epimerase